MISMGALREKVDAFAAFADNASLVAEFWRRQIARRGEAQAEALYRHLGFNHLEKKVEWEGLTLSRDPKLYEIPCIKSMAAAQGYSSLKRGIAINDLGSVAETL